MKKGELLRCLSVPIKFGANDIFENPWVILEGDGENLSAVYSTPGMKAQTTVKSDVMVPRVKVNGVMLYKAVGAMGDDINVTTPGSSLVMKSEKGRVSIPTYPHGDAEPFNVPTVDCSFSLEGDALRESIRYAKDKGTLWFREEHIASISSSGGTILRHPSSEMSLSERMFPGFIDIGEKVDVWNFPEFSVFNWDGTWIGYKKYREIQDGKWDQKILEFQFDKVGEMEQPDFSSFRRLGINLLLWTRKGISAGEMSEIELDVPFVGELNASFRTAIPSFPHHYTTETIEVFESPYGIKFTTGDWIIFRSKFK